MKHLKSDLILMLTACIWGFAFVAQRKGMDFIGPFTYNGIRFALGSLSLVPLIIFFDRKNKIQTLNTGLRTTLLFPLLAGILLFLGASFQQVGLQYTTAGKGGFITGLYVIFVPFIGILFGRKISPRILLGAFLALAGLYFLSLYNDLSTPQGNLIYLVISGKKELSTIKDYINSGDIFILICAFIFSLHVILIGWLSNKTNPLKTSSLQFAVCSLLSIIYALFAETITLKSIIDAAIPVLYGGFFSVGIAYTLQVIGQKGADPSRAAIILSFESVFAVIGGVLILHEKIGIPGIAGCTLMFLGILISQNILSKRKN